MTTPEENKDRLQGIEEELHEEVKLTKEEFELQMMQKSIKERLQELDDIVQEATPQAPVMGYIMVVDRRTEAGEREYVGAATGYPIDRIDLAMRFIIDETLRLEKEFGKAHLPEQTETFKRGLLFMYMKTLVDRFDLKDDDIDLNNLKKEIESELSIEDYNRMIQGEDV